MHICPGCGRSDFCHCPQAASKSVLDQAHGEPVTIKGDKAEEQERLRARVDFLERALEQALGGNHDVEFVIHWEDGDDVPRFADEGCVVVQCNESYGAQFTAPELAHYLREKATQEGAQ